MVSKAMKSKDLETAQCDSTRQEMFSNNLGIYIPKDRTVGPCEEYDEAGFQQLLAVQGRHFWNRGRHKILLKVLQSELARRAGNTEELRAIDMGGGCGGWLEYLHTHQPNLFRVLALADKSVSALQMAEPVVGEFADRYQIDLLDLVWSEEWDVVFLLDVIEHIPDHVEVLRQIRKSLRPGGLLFITAPALEVFWSYNDEFARHQRRYCRQDFHDLANQSGFNLIRANYFMFFLSPALILSRLLLRPPASATPEQLRAHTERSHRIPAEPLNTILYQVFAAESVLMNRVPFPWGTSILGVFQR